MFDSAPRPGRCLGLPVGVSRTVNLNRRLTDEEWERLVVQLREGSSTRAVARARRARCGNGRTATCRSCSSQPKPATACASVRPLALARAAIGAGFGVLGIASHRRCFGCDLGTLGDAMSGIALMAAAGVGMIVSGALRLPRWARLRERQMEALAARINLRKQRLKGTRLRLSLPSGRGCRHCSLPRPRPWDSTGVAMAAPSRPLRSFVGAIVVTYRCRAHWSGNAARTAPRILLSVRRYPSAA